MARVFPTSAGSFQHRFGGLPTHRGIVPRNNTQPLHFLYNFDTTDSLFPVRMSGVRDLPLCYCFPYSAGDVGYRIVSDEEIEILCMSIERVEHNFPCENYPDTFAETPVLLTPISYEEHKTLVCYLACEDHFLEKESFDAADQISLNKAATRLHNWVGSSVCGKAFPMCNVRIQNARTMNLSVL